MAYRKIGILILLVVGALSLLINCQQGNEALPKSPNLNDIHNSDIPLSLSRSLTRVRPLGDTSEDTEDQAKRQIQAVWSHAQSMTEKLLKNPCKDALSRAVAEAANWSDLKQRYNVQEDDAQKAFEELLAQLEQLAALPYPGDKPYHPTSDIENLPGKNDAFLTILTNLCRSSKRGNLESAITGLKYITAPTAQPVPSEDTLSQLQKITNPLPSL